MLNLGQSIALLMPSARFPAPVKPPFLCFETIVLIRGKMILWRQCLSLFPRTPIPQHCCTTAQWMPLPALHKPCRMLSSHRHSRAHHSTLLPPKNQTQARPAPSPTHMHLQVSRGINLFSLSHTPPPKSPYTRTSTESINLLLETGRAPLAWVQFFSVSQDWAQSLQQFTDSDVGCGYPHY